MKKLRTTSDKQLIKSMEERKTFSISMSHSPSFHSKAGFSLLYSQVPSTGPYSISTSNVS